MSKKEGLNFQEFFRTIYKFKFSILFIIIFVTLLAFLYQYYKKDIYLEKAIIEISDSTASDGVKNGDILNSATLSQSNIKTEMEVLKSKSVNKLALKDVDFFHRYSVYLEPIESDRSNLFSNIKNIFSKYKQIDIYNNTPFVIDLKRGYNIPFIIKPIDKDRFLLEVKSLGYKRIHKYNKIISNSDFEFKLIKVKDPKYKKYVVVVKDLEAVLEELQSKLKIKRTDMTSNSLLIELEDTIPQRAQAYVNKLVKAYLEQNIKLRTKNAAKKLDFINQQLAQISKKLKSSTKDLEKFRASENAINLTADSNNLIKKVSDIESKLEQLKMQRDILLTLKNEVRSEKGIDKIAIFGFNQNDNTIINMIEKLRSAIVERAALLESYTIYHPEVKKYTREINQLKKSITDYINVSIKVTNQKIEKLNQLLNSSRLELTQLPKKEQQYGNLKRKYLINEKLYNYLLEKKAEVSIIKESVFSNVRVIDYASLDLNPIKPKRKMIILMGFILGIILGILQAFVRSLFAPKTIEGVSPKYIEDKYKVKVLASIAHSPNLKSNILEVNSNINSKFTESFRVLRAELKYIKSLQKRNKIITISSHREGEGKTTIALNLASILGLGGKKVLFLDADLRESTIETKVPINKNIGLTNYLKGETGLINIIQTEIAKGVDMITSGTKTNTPSELLESGRFDELLEELKKLYEYIIIDTPAFIKYVDAKELIYHSDLNIYVIRDGYSYVESYELLEALKEFHETNVVLNDIDFK